MTARVRITVREERGNRVVLHTAEAETFDDCVETLREVRNRSNQNMDTQTGATVTPYVGLGGLVES